MTHSSIPGFYQKSLTERRELLAKRLDLSLEELESVLESGGLSAATADKIVENVIGVYALPLGLALHVQVNQRDRLAPLVVEEPSVIAAASNAAKMIRAGGGFEAHVPESLMIAQIELRQVSRPEQSRQLLLSKKSEILERANQALPGLVRRGGGARDLEVREIGPGHFALHLLVDTCDAMGANLVNTAAETLGPWLAELSQAQLGLRILSNLSDRRLVQVRVRVPGASLVGKLTDLSSEEVLDAIEAASVFAERDPYRAATHNKGIMNGLDSVVLATGNDYRAVEAGAHAYAARSGQYRPLATWRRDGQHLLGELEMPLALGVVGGTLRVHPTARLALALAQIESASDLAQLAACVGLASNLAALRALATEGIQRGHMSLHARSVAIAAGAQEQEVEAVASRLSAEKNVTREAAERILNELRSASLEQEPKP